MKARSSPVQSQGANKKKRSKKNSDQHGIPKSKSFPASVSSAAYDADESDNEDQAAASQQVSVQVSPVPFSLIFILIFSNLCDFYSS
jgi:hypothetical protein